MGDGNYHAYVDDRRDEAVYNYYKALHGLVSAQFSEESYELLKQTAETADSFGKGYFTAPTNFTETVDECVTRLKASDSGEQSKIMRWCESNSCYGLMDKFRNVFGVKSETADPQS